MTTKKQRIIFIILYLAYTSIYIARVNLSVAGHDMIKSNILNTVQLGLLGGVFSSIYAVGRLINGGISDNMPPYIMLSTGLFLSAFSNIIIGFFPPFFAIFIFWTVNAYAQSMLWGAVLCVMSKIYNGETAKKKTSVMVTSVATGNIIGILLVSALVTKFALKLAFIVPGLITGVLGFLVILSSHNIHHTGENTKEHIPVFTLLKNKDMLFMTIPAIFHGMMKDNVSLWMTVYIIDKYRVDLSTTSYYILLIPVLGLIGRLLYPICYKFCGSNEDTVSIISFVCCAILSLLLMSGVGGIAVSAICLGLIYTATSIINTSFLSIYPLKYTKTGNVSSVSGIMDLATYLGAGVSSLCYGFIIKSFGYSSMFLSWHAVSVLSVILMLRKSVLIKKGNFT